ncbi:LysM peptidoglycan-binding domain-containing protein [Flavobacterium sp.]|uniref:LysM peptidoglycan-binding domain-containing protein n=1 Tax=Flavobacterium sp. TaxID=239 RepID=UPI00333FE462
MKGIFWGWVLGILCSVSLNAQNRTHKVVAGETVVSLAQKYQVTPYDLYKVNPEAKNGLKPAMVLVLPPNAVVPKTKPTPAVVANKPNATVAQTSVPATHTVLAKETVFSISKKYGLPAGTLEALNPQLKTTGLQTGMVLVLKKGVPTPKPMPAPSITELTHVVQAQETKYGIATRYGISMAELEAQNPAIVDSLPVGAVLKIKKSASKPATTVAEPIKPKPVETLAYTVQNGETVFSLSRQFGLSEAALIRLNPELKDGLKEGMVLQVPMQVSFAKNRTDSGVKDLGQSANRQKRRELVLFLPFNAAKIQNDTVTGVVERLKKDKFLNMTLDFYSGALMAIDSARTLGLNVNVRIFDSQESRQTTAALDLLKQEDFSQVDAVIGPFYQINVEKVAAALEAQKIPVISPLSRDEGKSYSNLLQSTPLHDATKAAMLDYLQAKNGNIIAVVSPKKQSMRQYLRDYYEGVKLVGVADNGSVVADSIKKHFVKDRMNYVILATEKTGAVMTTTASMVAAQKDFKVQLVILEANETLDYEEIPIARLTKLKLMYPSVTRENDSPTAEQFDFAYRKKNKVFPNNYAIRGFDVTFDTLLRISQENGFLGTLEVASEHLENRFDYARKVSGGYTNTGVYILYYDEDLQLKQAN